MKSNKRYRKLMTWDGNNVFRRCAGNKGLARLTFKGKPTGAIHGTVKEIITDIQQFKPDECVVVFDGQGARAGKQEIYAGYKAHRMSSMDEVLYNQMQITIQILRAAGICVLHKGGVDGDDVLGALVKKVPDRVFLVKSNDKDMLQLVGDNCNQIRNLGSGPEIWTADTVLEKYGIVPALIPDYLALCGDGIDGIPGLPGCGPVNARELLQEWGSLKEIVLNRKDIPKWRKKLTAERDNLKKFLQLTRLDTSVISDSALQTMMPRFTPGKYSPELGNLLELHGLKWLRTWFGAHKPTVVSSTKGLWG